MNMITRFWELLIKGFEYGLLTRAVLVGLALAISSSFLGTFLVLKRYSMMGDGLAHVSFLATALAIFFNASPLYVALPLVSGVSILILWLSDRAQLHGDASIGLIASFAFALGTIFVSISSGFTSNISSYLFGNILYVTQVDVWMAVIAAFVVGILILLFFPDLFALTYDEEYAQVLGIKTKQLNYLLAILTSIIIVVGIRAVGTLLISSLIVFPTVTALQFSVGFKKTMTYAIFISVVMVLVGIGLSFFLRWPTGSSIVVANGILFMGVFGLRRGFVKSQ